MKQEAQAANEANKGNEKVARDQTTLVYVLYALHILFGITALIGVIVCHTMRDKTANTIYATHTKWQIVTFWTGLLGYAAAIYYIVYFGSPTILIVTLCWVMYRTIYGATLAWQQKAVGNVH